MAKKILVTATTFPRWKNDTEPSFVFDLSVLLAKKGYDITVLVPHHDKAKEFEVLDNLKIHRFPYFFKKYQKLCYEGGIIPNIKKSFLAKIQIPFLVLSEFFYTRKIIKKERIEIIHAHWILPQGLVAALIKKLYKIPYITTAHAGDIFPLKNSFLKLFAKFTLRNANFCTANSIATKNAVLNITNIKNIDIIPMGVDLSLFDKKNKSEKIKKKYNIKGPFLLTVGRLAEKKGINYLIEAMPSVLKEFPSTKLMIIGDGPEKPYLEQLTKKLNLDKNIIFTGKIQNKLLPEYYATADLFIGPSIITKSGDTEGLGIVFLEALASQTAVIGSNVGGIPDIIKNNETGLLVKQKNVEELSAAILKLLKDKKLREQLAKNGQQHVKNNYEWSIVVNKFDQVIKNI